MEIISVQNKTKNEEKNYNQLYRMIIIYNIMSNESRFQQNVSSLLISIN